MTISIQLKPDERALIERAAQLCGQSPSDFVAEAARQAAEKAPLDRKLIKVILKTHAEFLARLDAPPAPSASKAFSSMRSPLRRAPSTPRSDSTSRRSTR